MHLRYQKNIILKWKTHLVRSRRAPYIYMQPYMYRLQGYLPSKDAIGSSLSTIHVAGPSVCSVVGFSACLSARAFTMRPLSGGCIRKFPQGGKNTCTRVASKENKQTEVHDSTLNFEKIHLSPLCSMSITVNPYKSIQNSMSHLKLKEDDMDDQPLEMIQWALQRPSIAGLCDKSRELRVLLQVGITVCENMRN